MNKTILKPRLAAATGRQYVYVGFSRRNKIPRSSAYTIAEKAIRFRHPDYNPDRAQKLINSSMSRQSLTRNVLSKSMHAFWVYLANSQTDRQTDRHGQKHLPPPLSEVNKQNTQAIFRSFLIFFQLVAETYCKCPWKKFSLYNMGVGTQQISQRLRAKHSIKKERRTGCSMQLDKSFQSIWWIRFCFILRSLYPYSRDRKLFYIFNWLQILAQLTPLVGRSQSQGRI